MLARARSHILGLAFAGAVLAITPPAHAESGDVETAAAEYESGRQAYKDKRYSEAADHFEQAFAAVPSAQALRNAIRARREARELERAATLAGIAEKTYAGDNQTMVLVREVLSEASPRLMRLEVQCKPACKVRVDGTQVTVGDAAEEQVVFVKSGTRSVEARFQGKGQKATSIEAKSGGREELKFEPEDDEGSKEKGSKEKGDKEKGDKDKTQVVQDDRPFPRGVFYGGVALSVLFAGLTLGSYIDLKRVENEEITVTKQCADENADPDCYPTGEVSAGARSRTYIVAGVTGGLIVGTAVVGLYFTRWGSKDPDKKASSNSRLEPWAVPTKGGAAVGLGGRF